MSSRRTLILIGALVAGAIAALLIFQYVGGIEEKAKGDAQLVDVVIAKAQITKGQSADELIASGAIGIGQRRQVELPANRVARPEEIKSQIAQLDLAPGTIITSSMFMSDAAVGESYSSALEPGLVAVTTSADQVKAVAGLVRQGDYVNLTYVGSCRVGASGEQEISTGGGGGGGDTDPNAGAATPATPCAGSVYQKVRILAIGQSLGAGISTPVATPGDTAPATTEAPTSDLITFAVPPEAAQVIQFAGPGTLYMTLVRKDYVPVPLPILPAIPAAGAKGLTPYPDGDPAAEGGGQ